MPNNPHDSWADIYDEAYIQSFGSIYSELTKTSLNIIQKNTKPGAEILDIGAGTGRLSIPLMKLGYSLSAVDASKNMLEVLKRKDTEQVIDTIHCLIQNLDLNRNFEAVLCVFSVFCYLLDEKDLRAAIQSIVNHTHREGFVLIDVPSKTLFTSSYYESEALIREIEVKSVDSELEIFDYLEKIKTADNKGQFNYEDKFKIRYWDSEIILNEFKREGMDVREDISDKFFGSGAEYFILNKS